MIFAAMTEAADRGELLLVQDGLCRFHLRRDGVVVIREVIVLPFRRGTNVGRRMVEEVLARHPGKDVLAKCPADYESNGFWARLGFVCEKEGKVNEWRLRRSSTAQAATPLFDGLPLNADG
jgi:GNAT superfamily N-acetyltransferase